MTVAKARKVGWLTESAADIISEELRKELLRAMREEFREKQKLRQPPVRPQEPV
jgi:hypothetical protein